MTLAARISGRSTTVSFFPWGSGALLRGRAGSGSGGEGNASPGSSALELPSARADSARRPPACGLEQDSAAQASARVTLRITPKKPQPIKRPKR
ncbi:MAG: hypothetical protein B6A08_05325 [Sorangiineae bacterium NIC37A_2]|nr:MAG: hypothetical protein B6A08_05325 [Sorangiineae bacterium NIC37A_2]